jgi:hypothetical protein
VWFPRHSESRKGPCRRGEGWGLQRQSRGLTVLGYSPRSSSIDTQSISVIFGRLAMRHGRKKRRPCHPN